MNSKNQVFSLLMAGAMSFALGCNKSDDKKSSYQKPTVLGQAKKPGVLPDGRPAPSLNENQVKSVMENFKGIGLVNGAATKAAANEGAKGPFSSSQKAETQLNKMLKATNVALGHLGKSAGFKSSLTIGEIINLPSQNGQASSSSTASNEVNKLDEETLKHWTSEIQKNCAFDIKNLKYEGNGNENAGHVSGQGWIQIKGDSCAVTSDERTSVTMDFVKNGQAREFNGEVAFSSQTISKSVELTKQASGFLSDKISGQVNINMSQSQSLLALAGVAKFKGAISTQNSPDMSGEVLVDFDLASTGTDGSNYSNLQHIGVDVAVIIESSEGTILLQVFVSQNAGQSQPDVKIYLNGKVVTEEQIKKAGVQLQ